MTVKIAHISDLHYESRDATAASELIDALKQEQPDYLIVTGDFANNPWKLTDPQVYVSDLCTQCGLDKSKTFAVAGNHDYRILGNFGFKPFGQWIFRKTFKGWLGAGFVPLQSSPPITLVLIDSNPTLLGFARGRFGYLQARRLRGALKRLPKAELDSIRDSTIIAVLHHHPLPVPYQGGDFFLVLRNSQTMVLWLAEIGADVVLHGHKHRATYSGLSIGTSTGPNRIIQVLGAGTCMKSDDHDPRGSNFNVITIEDCGLRYVRQFFAQPGEPFRELPIPKFVTEAFDDAYERACGRLEYRVHKLHWDLLTDYEGDRLNDFLYSGVVANTGKAGNEFPLPCYTLDTGHTSEPSLKEGAPRASLTFKLTDRRKVEELKVNFDPGATDVDPVSFRTQSYDYNAVSLDESEFKRKFPARSATGKIEEFEEKEISVPVHHFSWTLTFPSDFKFRYAPRFEVFDLSGRQRHGWLTKVLEPCFQFSESTNTAFLAVRRPPVGYLYRITWPSPERSAAATNVTVGQRIQVDELRQRLLVSNEGSQQQRVLATRLSTLLLALNALLNQYLSKNVGTEIERVFDISLMALDDGGLGQPPSLKLVAGLPCFMESVEFRNLSLEIGDGNAGRAYRKNIVRYYDRSEAKGNPKNHTYVEISASYHHRLLFSVPLRHPGNPSLICCILNVGAFGEADASALSVLKQDTGNAWLIAAGHEFLLTKLGQECNVNLV